MGQMVAQSSAITMTRFADETRGEERDTDDPKISITRAVPQHAVTLLDGSTYNSKNVILLGDYNDYLTGTQCDNCSPAISPYKVA